MSYKIKFLIFILLLHAAEVSISVFVLRSNKTWFLVSEVIIISSLIFSIYFWITFTRPFTLIRSGIDSLKDKDFNIRLVPVGQNDLDMLINVYNQMLDQLRMERTLQQEQHFFLDKLIMASPAGIIILDLNERISMINPMAEVYTGCSFNAIKNLPLNSIPSQIAKDLSEIPENETKVIQLSGLKKIKIQKSYFINRGFRNVFLVLEELTHEINKAEHAAYEKVIRTISHEFNNSIGPINSILGSLKYYSGELTSDHRIDFETAIDVAIDRNLVLNGFIKRYAEVFKLPAPLKEACEIHDLLDRIERIFYLDFQQANIRLIKRYASKTPVVMLDVHQIELVVTNILKNAMEAIQNNGQIELTTTFQPPALSIVNNGNPIPTQVQKNLFSPFFTTKKTGQGIGLTMVREILNLHHFSFSLETRNDGLTEFSIDFQEK